jgi:hypothetical protein
MFRSRQKCRESSPRLPCRCQRHELRDSVEAATIGYARVSAFGAEHSVPGRGFGVGIRCRVSIRCRAGVSGLLRQMLSPQLTHGFLVRAGRDEPGAREISPETPTRHRHELAPSTPSIAAAHTMDSWCAQRRGEPGGREITPETPARHRQALARRILTPS